MAMKSPPKDGMGVWRLQAISGESPRGMVGLVVMALWLHRYGNHNFKLESNLLLHYLHITNEIIHTLTGLFLFISYHSTWTWNLTSSWQTLQLPSPVSSLLRSPVLRWAQGMPKEPFVMWHPQGFPLLGGAAGVSQQQQDIEPTLSRSFHPAVRISNVNTIGDMWGRAQLCTHIFFGLLLSTHS